MSRKLKALRALEGKTQYDISRESGICQSRISLIENGYVKVQREEAAAIAHVLGRKPEELFPES